MSVAPDFPMAVQQLSLSFDPDAMGRHQPWTAYHRGREYRGEVIVAEAFDPDWGLRLDPELSFRLVFFTRPRRIPYQKVMDPRIAMAVPRRSVSEESAELGAELGAVHEARERYVTGEDPDRSALRRSMDDRASSLRGEMGRRYARSWQIHPRSRSPGSSIWCTLPTRPPSSTCLTSRSSTSYASL